MKRLLCVVGARPNFMKMAPIIQRINQHPGEMEAILVHTGQHYDYKMSQVFFEEFGIKKPDYFLNVGSDTHAKQTAKIMTAFDDLLAEQPCDWVIVAGDVNSTVACGLVAVKKYIRVAHVEAGLRSFDRSMPEEINRIVTDHISDALFITEESGNVNLTHEGIPQEKQVFVGNAMIDTLNKFIPKVADRKFPLKKNLKNAEYILVTLHRPSNVDDIEVFAPLMKMLYTISKEIDIVFPAHPRTMKKLRDDAPQLLSECPESCHLIEPLGYLDFLCLMSRAKLVMTDSGGIQEETTILQIPCLTLRENTERPVTVELGTNQIIGANPEVIRKHVKEIIAGNIKEGSVPPLWDGRASERIINYFLRK